MQQWGFNCQETYSPVVTWISVRSILAISSIHKFPIVSIPLYLPFPNLTLIWMSLWGDILGMGAGGNRE